MSTMSQQVHWVQFPAAALTDRSGRPVDWTNHADAHRAVSRLFTPGLPGNHEKRRALAAILYRLDMLRTDAQATRPTVLQPTVLVQSLAAPELVPAGARAIVVPNRAWSFDSGQPVAFRVALNAIRRTTRRYSDPEKRVELEGAERFDQLAARKQTCRVIPAGEILSWITEKLSGALTDVVVSNHSRDRTCSGRQSVVVDTVDGFALVEDPETFDRVRIQGIGRAKAYGCGLLTATRLITRPEMP